VDGTLSTLGINGVVVDFGEDCLRDSAGRQVPLRPQAFAVLHLLAERPGELVTKDELMAAVWPGIAVTDDSLVQAIGDIRRALGDEAHAVIRTVPRRGYRLVPPPEAPAASALRAGRPRRSAALLAAALLAVGALAGWVALRPGPAAEPAAASIAGPPILAVVPFVDLAGDEASRSLGEAFYRNCVHELSQFREFHMVLRGPTFVYREEQERGLPVDYVLGGTVDRQGDRLRLTAELTSARTGEVVWSERWDRPERDVLAMREEVAQGVVNRLGGATGLIQEAGRAAAQAKPPAERGAWDLLLLGSGRLTLGTRAGAAEAADLLGEAVSLDPGLAHAEALRALAHLRLAEFGEEPADNLRIARDAAGQALFLDPGDAWGYVALGAIRRREGDLARARTEYETALNLTPNVTEIMTHFAGWAATAGEPERGAALADKVARLEPSMPPWAAAELARAYFMAGRYRAAQAMIERLPEEAATPALTVIYAAALAAGGRRGEAAAAAAAALAADPGLSIEDVIADPGWGQGERRRLVETMRLAGFPACAAGAVDDPALRLSECGPREQAGRWPRAETKGLDARPVP
jgi:DNA-binding winged helix-turn-helix (wHTH) protein/TolB-like protein/tetratricopeptide (TPR) repeat protein